MPLDFDDEMQQYANIKVIGVGGGGNNAINRMIEAGLKGESLLLLTLMLKLYIYPKRTPRSSWERNSPRFGSWCRSRNWHEGGGGIQRGDKKSAYGSDMVFVTAGMGEEPVRGAPIIARIAKESGALTVGVVTKPFSFEGRKRNTQAERGTQSLREQVDSLITIPNDRLLQVVDKHTNFNDAFKIADDILRQGYRFLT